MVAATQPVAASKPRLLCFWTERPFGAHVRIEYIDTDGVKRTTAGVLCDGFIRWSYDLPPDEVDELAYLVCYDGAEHTFPGVEYGGQQSAAEMEAAVEHTCFGCGTRVESVDELSERGECSKCFVARMARCTECDRSRDGYVPTAADAKLAPSDGLCEACHADHVRAAKRDRADAIREGRGDYLRDMQKGAVSS